MPKQYPVTHTDAEWKKLLTPEQYADAGLEVGRAKRKEGLEPVAGAFRAPGRKQAPGTECPSLS